MKDLGPADAERVAALLDEAMDLPHDERLAWEQDLARREPQLHRLVADLLATMALAAVPRASRDAAAPPPPAQPETAELIARGLVRATREPAALEGRRFGPYRVLRLLGRGGMGSVWLAERADGLFTRQVALKLVHASLAGPTLADRFARERRILGALQHPHIARLLDAGVADDGQPYLAIEYVEGQPITTWCDAQHLPLAARIALVLQVLSAVQYAHQNLVVHRDLKPQNILVTPEGQVRLLDFGIAKLLGDDGQARETELTQLGGRALTPDYASPEQIAGGAVSTASDVYSLGVLLYTLLCGQRPYQLRRDSRGALEDAILSAAPLRPSQQPISEAAAQARAGTPRRLAQQLAGDLDTIVLQALKKDPAERYATADALRQDLQRYLAGEPVQARPDRALYRLRKYVGRHRWQVGAGLAIGGLVLGAAAVSLWQAGLAREQATLAQRETRRAQAVQGFLLDIFRANSVDQPDPVRARQTTARELLDAGARRAAESLQGAPEAQSEVLGTLADMYFQLGLGDDAAHMRLQRVAAVKQAFGVHDARVAQALIAYARDVSNTGQRARAEQALAEAREVLDATGDPASPTRGLLWVESARFQQYTSLRRMRTDAEAAVRHFRAHPARWENLVQAMQLSGRAYHLAGDSQTAEAQHLEAVAEIGRHHPGPTHWAFITPLVYLAEAQTHLLKLDEAEQNLRRALAISMQLNGDLSGVTLQTQAKLGGFLHATGRRDEGLQLMQDTLAAAHSKEANATPDALGTLHRMLGAALLAEGRLAAGETHLATEVADLRRDYPGATPLAKMLLLHAVALTAQGRYEQAGAELEEAERIWRDTGGDAVEPDTVNRHLLEQARLLLARGDAAAAQRRLARVVAPRHAARLPLRLDETQARIAQAQARLMQDQPAPARELAQQALEHVQASPLRARFARLEAEAALWLGRAEQRTGTLPAARAHLEHALQLRQRDDDPGSPWLAEVQIALAECLLAQGESRAARALARQAQAIHAGHAELGAHQRLPLQALLARLGPR
jgi:serine/threonine protein kinase